MNFNELDNMIAEAQMLLASYKENTGGTAPAPVKTADTGRDAGRTAAFPHPEHAAATPENAAPVMREDFAAAMGNAAPVMRRDFTAATEETAPSVLRAPSAAVVGNNTSAAPENTASTAQNAGEKNIDSLMQELDLLLYEDAVFVPDGEDAAAVLETQHRRSTASVVSSILFYFTLFVIVLAALVYRSGDGSVNTIFGYASFNVLTGSMDPEIPAGSFVLVKKTAAGKIEREDVITFYKDAETTVTHRVIEIYENYDGEGGRGFKTKGIANPMADDEIVYYKNVIGKVVWSTPKFGRFIDYLKQRYWIVVLLVVLLFAFWFCIKTFWGERKSRKQKQYGADAAIYDVETIMQT